MRNFLGWPHPFSLATPLINESSCNDFLYNEHPTHGLIFLRFTMSLRKFFTSAGDEDDDNSENEDGPCPSKRPSTEPAKHS